ncbi:MAG: response regulator [Gallionellaceae bacterium]
MSARVILLIEDESGDAGLVQWAIGKNKFLATLHHVADGHEALKFLRREGQKYGAVPRPDLILLDLNMPRMTGREFLSLIKRDASFNNIPVVVLTTSNAESDILETRDLGASDYYTKPMDLNQLVETVGELGKRWINAAR